MFVLIGIAAILLAALFRGTSPITGFRFSWCPFIGPFFLFFIMRWIFFSRVGDTEGITGRRKKEHSKRSENATPEAR